MFFTTSPVFGVFSPVFWSGVTCVVYAIRQNHARGARRLRRRPPKEIVPDLNYVTDVSVPILAEIITVFHFAFIFHFVLYLILRFDMFAYILFNFPLLSLSLPSFFSFFSSFLP